MESAIAVYKLIVLYMLDRAGEYVAKPEISGFLLENGYGSFTSLAATFAEIEQDGFVSSRTAGDLTSLALTQEGRQTLHFFDSELSDEIKGQVNAFLKENGRKLRNEQAVETAYYRVSEGYMAHLSVKERSESMISIDLPVPDEETAQAVCRKWKTASSKIYSEIISELF